MSADVNPTTLPTPKRARKRAKRFPRNWKPVFLAELARTCNVTAAAKKAGIHRDTAYAARADPLAEVADPEAEAFTRAWDTALEEGVDTLELEAHRRAFKGVLEPAGWYQGKAGGKVRRYSDTLAIFLLKAHRPEKYRENVHQELTGAGGAPLVPISVIEPVPPAPAIEHTGAE